jgi:hypothetical protein
VELLDRFLSALELRSLVVHDYSNTSRSVEDANGDAMLGDVLSTSTVGVRCVASDGDFQVVLVEGHIFSPS